MAAYLSVALIKKIIFVLRQAIKNLYVCLFVNKMPKEIIMRNSGHHGWPTLEFIFQKFFIDMTIYM